MAEQTRHHTPAQVDRATAAEQRLHEAARMRHLAHALIARQRRCASELPHSG